MKWTEMLTCDVKALREHYASVRNLAYNNARIAQHCRPGGPGMRKLLRGMDYLMTQVSMCENAARKRGVVLVA